MLRRGLVALMMGAICASTAAAGDAPSSRTGQQRHGILSWLKPGSREASRTAAPASGVRQAVVEDAASQAPRVRQTSSHPQDDSIVVAQQPGQSGAQPLQEPGQYTPQPVAIQQAPVVPNMNPYSGPQYFSAGGGEFSNPIPVHPGANWQTYQPPVPVQMTSQAPFYSVGSSQGLTGPVAGAQGPMAMNQPIGMYPQTGASLYPAPVPGIPQQIGGTAVINQAFHPHEMLYAHEYHAMYPPYYYKVNGGWMVTPFGVWSHEDWKLEGTRVDVKYKSHISPFSGFHSAHLPW